MAGFRIEGNTTGNVAEVTAGNNLRVDLASVSTLNEVHTLMHVENDDGTNNPGGAYRKNLMISEARRLKVGLDTVLFGDVFNQAYIDGNKYIAQVGATALPITQVGAGVSAGGYVGLNGPAGGVTTTGGVALFMTRPTFALYGNFELLAEFDMAWNQAAIPANAQVEWGFGVTTNTAATPTDGVFFRMTTSGLVGVITYNSAVTGYGEVVTPILTNGVGAGATSWAFTQDKKHHFQLILDEEHAEFWVDGSLRGELDYGTVRIQQAMLWAANSQPMFVKQFHSGATATAMTTKLATWNVMLIDVASNRTWAGFLSGLGQHACQAQTAQTINGQASVIGSTGVVGSTDALLSTNIAPKAINTLSATALATGGVNGLGGWFAITWGTTSQTAQDWIVSSYQIPTNSASTIGKRLVVTGVRIDQSIQAATTAAATHFMWMLSFGGSALNATTDVTNNATPAKGFRKLPLGIQSCTTAACVVGQQFQTIDYKLQTPITIYAGEFINVCAKPLVIPGTNSLVTYATITFDGYWE